MFGLTPADASRLLPADTAVWYQVREGLPRPDWKAIREWIGANVQIPGQDLAWCQAACDWLERLGNAMGTSYIVHESPTFLMLMSGSDAKAESMLGVLEEERKRISAWLGPAAWREYLGKPVVIVLQKQDEYYTYICDFYPEKGRFSKSHAIFIPEGYAHMVIPDDRMGWLRPTIAHETVHACLAHLPMPRWLGEGLAQFLAGDGYYRRTGNDLRREVPRRFGGMLEDVIAFRRSWTTQTIQSFWSGHEFHGSSYCLADMLVRRLQSNKGFKEFILHANKNDAGEAAAGQWLQMDLKTAMEEILGQGDWTPKPKTWPEEPDKVNA